MYYKHYIKLIGIVALGVAGYTSFIAAIVIAFERIVK